MSTTTHEMLIDLTEITKAVYEGARKAGQVLYDNERGFVTMKPEQRASILYLHIKNKYYFSPLLVPHTLIDGDAFDQLCASVNEIEPRHTMTIRSPRLWSVTSTAA